MTKNRYLGIYMDHSTAHLMEIIPGGINAETINSEFTHELKEQDVKESETHMHNAEHHLQTAFYKKLGNVIKDFHEVLLFGPTTAKNELLNYLKKDHLFSAIKVQVKHSDKLTHNQQQAVVHDYFAIHNV